MQRLIGVSCAAVLAACVLSSFAADLAAPFRDNMVLQRDLPIKVWGTGTAGETVSVSFAGANVSTNADASGKWIVTLPPLPASREPRVLTAGDRTISNVLVGEVWIASGQSNMVVPLDGDSNRFRDQDGRLLAARTRRADVRLMTTPSATASSEKSGWGSSVVAWESVDPDNAAQLGFSAIGWRFAVGLHDALDVPVGVIFNAWNGSRIEGWIPAEGYAAVGLDPADATQVYDAGGYGTPKSIWNGKVCPLAPMTVRGFLWYQGESNCSTAGYGENKLGGIPQYAQLLKALYEGWKVRFGNPELKMVFAGLATWGNGNEYLMNEEQQKFADAEPNAAMAVINDIGIVGDIHGSDKARTAERMISLALQHAYGRDLKADSPRCRSAVANGATVTLGFDNVEGLRLWSMREVALTTNFQLAGEDGAFYDAAIQNFQVYTNESGSTLLSKGNIVGDTIRLKSDKVAAPRYVRYLHNSGRMGNIFNERSLPLAAFTAPVGAVTAAMVHDLTADETIDVPAGETRRIGILGGGAFTLTKTGEGTLVFTGSTNAQAKVVVAAGTVGLAAEGAPDVLREAVFHVDASYAPSLTVTPQGGTNFVSKWTDRRIAGEELGFTPNCAQQTGTYKPFLRRRFQNGRDILDFGGFYRSAMGPDPMTGAARAGWGGSMTWATAIDDICDVFTVVSDTPDLKYAYVRCPTQSHPGTPFVGDTTSHWNWIRPLISSGLTFGNGANVRNPALLRDDVDVYSGPVKNGEMYLDGCTANSQTVMPDGFHLLEFRPTTPCYGNAFARIGEISYGGQRIGEFVVFNRKLEPAERLAVQAYLQTKWLPVRLATLELRAGATLDLPANTSLLAAKLDMDETARVTGQGVLAADPSSTIRAVGARTVKGADDGVTARLAFDGPATLDAVDDVRTDAVTGSGLLTKDGSGALTTVALDAAFTDLDVREGVLRVNPLLTREAVYHVDANEPDSMGFDNPVGGTNFVCTWRDVNRNGRYAYASAGIDGFRLRDFQNGRAIIDFGSLKNGKVNNPAGWGGSMKWSLPIPNIREVFTVASDTPDVYDIVEKYGAAALILSPYFVGNDDTSRHYWIRPFFDSKDDTAVILRDMEPNKSALIDAGKVLLDGEAVAPTSTRFPRGFHVLNFQCAADMFGNSFARSHNQSQGGQRIGEFLVFTNLLDAAQRDVIGKTLIAKWLGGTNTCDRICRTVAVAKGATLDLTGQGLIVDGELALEGTLVAAKVETRSRLSVAAGATLEASLVLADGATLTLSGTSLYDVIVPRAKKVYVSGTVSVELDHTDPLVLNGQSVRVLQAEEVVGEANWRLTGPLARYFSVTFETHADGVYAKFRINRGGLQILLR